MAKFLNQDIYVSVDGHDISDHCFSIDTPSEREQIDVSGFNSTGAKEYLAGTKTESIVVGILQDFAAGEVHDILSDLYQNQSTFVIEVRPTSSAVSATNPRKYGNAQLLSYNGLSGQIGARSEITATFTPADSTGFVWSDS